MSTFSELPFIIANIIAVIAELLILTGALIYLVKKKSNQGWIMVLASSILVLMFIVRPIFFQFIANSIDSTDYIMQVQGIISIVTTLASLAFATGFIWAMSQLKKDVK